MEAILFRCTSCNQALKVGADRAGLKFKCKKCGQELTVPQSNSPAKAPPSPSLPEEEEEGGAYQLTADEPETSKEEAKPKKKPKEKKAVVKRAVRKKAVQFADEWRKVLIALWLIFGGMCIWGITWVLHTTLILMGLLTTSLYSPLELSALQGGDLDMATFAIGLVVNQDNLNTGKSLFLIEQVLNLLAGLVFLGGYCLCLAVPNRYGSRGQAIALLAMGLLNLLLGLIFRLLPATGALSYTMVPLFAPEMTLNVANLDRVFPLAVFWSKSAFWEFFAAIIIQFLFYMEPILFGTFLRATALAIKDDGWLEPKALVLIRLGFGQVFMLLTFYMMSVTGTSEVLAWALMSIYLLWRCFLIGFIVYYALAMWQSRERIKFLLDEEEDEEDEEEDRPRKGSLAKKWEKVALGLMFTTISAVLLLASAGAFVAAIALAIVGGLLQWSGLVGIGGLVALLAVVCYSAMELPAVIGYGFCLNTPNKKGTLPLAIVCLVFGSVNLVSRVVFLAIPFFSAGGIGAGEEGSAGPGSGLLAQLGILGGILLLVSNAEWIVFPLYLRAVVLVFKEKYLEQNCFIPLALACGVIGCQVAMVLVTLIKAVRGEGGTGFVFALFFAILLLILFFFSLSYLRTMQAVRRRVVASYTP